jgi:transcriptional regulator with XRE-family HTH domain
VSAEVICVDLQDPVPGSIPPILRWLGPAETATLAVMPASRPAPRSDNGPNSICARIREERERRNLTQQELAEMIGVTEQSVSRYERERPPKIATLQKIAQAMGMNVQDFMPDARITDPELAWLVEWFKSSSRMDRRMVVQLARSLDEARAGDEIDPAQAQKPLIRKR